MAQDPLHVLWIEPHFPGRLGAVADWLVRRRGYRCTFYCHRVEPRDTWPGSVGNGLEVNVFGLGGIAKDQAVTWSRTLERSLCYSYGCWEVLDKKRPPSLDLVVGRSMGLGSSLFAPVYAPAAPVVSYLDYFYHAHRHDLAGETGLETAPAYFHWRRSMAAIDLLDLEQAALGWTPTAWQRGLYPVEYRDSVLVLHDGIDTRRFTATSRSTGRTQPRSIAGRTIPGSTRVVSFVARSLDRLRGLDRFLKLADVLLRSSPDILCVIMGDPIVRRGLDVTFHNRDYVAHLLGQNPPFDLKRLWFLGNSTPAVVAEVLAASDLHVAPCRPYPVARSLLEAMAAGAVVLASDTEPHHEVITHGQTGLLFEESDLDSLAKQALDVLAGPAAYRPLGDAASALVHERYSQDVCLPRLAQEFGSLAAARGGWR
jgi:glycosyltransferase involved in cell wall biosynthesis